MTTRCQYCHVEIDMLDFGWTDSDGNRLCLRAQHSVHEPLPATPAEEQLGWLGVYAGPPQGWSR